MLSATRLKVIGAGLAATALFGGHALTAHADAPGDAQLIADGALSNAGQLAADPATWSDPNLTCGPSVSGHPVTNGNTTVTRVAAEEAAEADLTCFSFTNLNYTVTATLTIKDYNFSTRTWVPVCTTGAFNTAAIEGLSTQHLILECFDPVGTPTSSHLHEAELTWNTSLGTAGVAHSSWWVIDY